MSKRDFGAELIRRLLMISCCYMWTPICVYVACGSITPFTSHLSPQRKRLLRCALELRSRVSGVCRSLYFLGEATCKLVGGVGWWGTMGGGQERAQPVYVYLWVYKETQIVQNWDWNKSVVVVVIYILAFTHTNGDKLSDLVSRFLPFIYTILKWCAMEFNLWYDIIHDFII